MNALAGAGHQGGAQVQIAVLMGGTSAERDVSLSTGREIARALRTRGHGVVPIDAADGGLIEGWDTKRDEGTIGREPPDPSAIPVGSAGDLTRALERLAEERGVEAAFVALHGGAGEDGRIQALLELIGLPYTGSDHLGSALAMDKLVSKQLFAAARIPTPPCLVGGATASEVAGELGGFPVIVKPSHEGSTVGVTVVEAEHELAAALEEAGAFEGPPLIERFIPGRELAVGVLGAEALPIVEIRPSHLIYDYECKYTPGLTRYEVPAPLTPRVEAEVRALAERAHSVLRLSGYSRVDFRLDESDRPYCLEANSLPGMTPTSLLPKAAAAVGLSFEDLCERIVEHALRRGNRKAGAG